MLVFCHMFIGAVVGLLLMQWTGKRWMVPVAALGAILPDLVDKPLGHLLLVDSLDSGRIIGHTLLLTVLVIAIGLVWWKYRSSLVIGAIGLGMGTHLALDAMWTNLVTLFWPLLGPFAQYHYPDYFGVSIVTELTAPSEWAFGLLFVSIMVILYRDNLGKGGSWLAKNLEPLQLPLLAFLLVIGVMTLGSGFLTMFVDIDNGQNLIIQGACAVVGSGFLMLRELRKPMHNIKNY